MASFIVIILEFLYFVTISEFWYLEINDFSQQFENKLLFCENVFVE